MAREYARRIFCDYCSDTIECSLQTECKISISKIVFNVCPECRGTVTLNLLYELFLTKEIKSKKTPGSGRKGKDIKIRTESISEPEPVLTSTDARPSDVR